MGKHNNGEKYMADDDWHQVCSNWNTGGKLAQLNFITENIINYMLFTNDKHAVSYFYIQERSNDQVIFSKNNNLLPFYKIHT
jgi:hypothetical protein